MYDTDVPKSPGQAYPERKRWVMELVPMGGVLARPACGNTEGIHGRALVRLLNDIEML